MLRFEREVVATLADPELDEGTRAAVESYVDDSLRSMPEYLRAGVVAESLLFRSWVGVARALGNRRPLSAHVERWKASPIDPMRQYVRLLHSLVLFAENELGCEAGG
jgi:hypothetical protein